MFDVFLEVVLPVALVAVLGGLVGRWRRLPLSPISTLVFYLFTPSLVFHSMATTQLSAGASLRIVGVTIGTYAAMYLIATVYSLIRRHDAPMRAAVALSATSANSGNMGLPVSQLAFGEVGLQIAVVNFVAASVMANTTGIAIASLAGGSAREALRAPFRYPALYAAFLGVAVNALSIDLPVTIESPVSSLAGAAVPTMLVVLGLQLQNAAGRDNLFDTLAVSGGKLLIGPAAAWLIATLVGLEGVNRGTLVVLAAMPTAVIATILATEFKANATFVTRTVVTTTIGSMATLSVLITLVR